ncbi:MAG: DUF6398 domain-containing protein [Kiritimatiellae bacterium]|nr:DUF6398 domain-containing protein [Kiritimatiellia bacterium]
MGASADKQMRIDEVQALLDAFSKEYLTEELTEYLKKLWEKVGRKRTYVITGGKVEIWASAVVYVIARLNFLFDRDSPNYLTADQICEFFDTKKSTVSARAKDIEKACKIRMGHEGLCNQELSDSLTLVKLSNGMVITMKMAREMGACLTRCGS